ncbi:MAG: hypothetical protein ACLT38_04970 [Akkermansia sp.]
MGLIDKLKRTFVAPIVEEKEEGAAMVRSLRETGTAALAHAEALAALLKLELKEASNRLGKNGLSPDGRLHGFFGYRSVVPSDCGHGVFLGNYRRLAVTTGFHLLAAAAGSSFSAEPM